MRAFATSYRVLELEAIQPEQAINTTSSDALCTRTVFARTLLLFDTAATCFFITCSTSCRVRTRWFGVGFRSKPSESRAAERPRTWETQSTRVKSNALQHTALFYSRKAISMSETDCVLPQRLNTSFHQTLLTLWRPLLPYGYRYKASCAILG